MSVQINAQPRDVIALNLLVWALKADFDDYGKGQSIIVAACEDFIRNYKDHAQDARWQQHAKALRKQIGKYGNAPDLMLNELASNLVAAE